jgi:predicted DNA binding protein
MGTTEMVQNVFDQLPTEVRRHITIDQVTESMPSVGGMRSLLTERQREVLDAATELGYYTVPRQVTASDVAAAVACAPSTASEHLRKIEARILSSVANEYQARSIQ